MIDQQERIVFRDGKVIQVGTGRDGKPRFMAPIPIKADKLLEGIQWGMLGTPEEATAKSELARMLQIYQRECAWQQPSFSMADGVRWAVQFPTGSSFQSGPKSPDPWQALLDNYSFNHKFKGIMVNEVGYRGGDSLFHVERIIDESLAHDEKVAKETAVNVTERIKAEVRAALDS